MFEISREQLDDLDPSGRWVYAVRPISDALHQTLSVFSKQELVEELVKRGATKWYEGGGVAVWGTTHEEMCRMYRFTPLGHRYFDRGNPLSEVFEKRFKELGGFSPTISKNIGWEK